LKTAYILIFIFVSFLTAPTVVVLIDNSTDISYIFSTTEEESKNNISTEYTFNEARENQISIEFLRKKALINHLEKHDLQSLCLEVISPPPDLA